MSPFPGDRTPYAGRRITAALGREPLFDRLAVFIHGAVGKHRRESRIAYHLTHFAREAVGQVGTVRTADELVLRVPAQVPCGKGTRTDFGFPVSRGHEDHQPRGLFRGYRGAEPFELVADVLVDPAGLVFVVEAHDEREQVALGQFAAGQFLLGRLNRIQFGVLIDLGRLVRADFGQCRALAGLNVQVRLAPELQRIVTDLGRFLLDGLGVVCLGRSLCAIDAETLGVEQGGRVLFLALGAEAQLQRAGAIDGHSVTS